MNILFKKIKSGIFTTRDSYLWVAIDEFGRTGTGHSQAESLGDLFLGYNNTVQNEDGTQSMEIKNVQN